MTPRDAGPVSVEDGRAALATRLSPAAGLLVGLDFDGTLAPIDPDPDVPEATPRNRSVLQTLVAHPNVDVAVVSGRAVDDLVPRVDVTGVEYVGNHGLERRAGGQRSVHPAAEAYRQPLDRVADRASAAVADVPGAFVENKEVTLSVHFRETPRDAVDAVADAVSTAVAAVDPDLRVDSGKEVLEVKPPVDADKGSVLEALAADTPPAWATVYVGDDTTDEDAFQVVGPDGAGVLVGDRTETAAEFRLPSQSDVAPFLEWLRDDVVVDHSSRAT